MLAILILGYATVFWILPSFVGGIGFISDRIRPAKDKEVSAAENPTLAPPTLSIPFESTSISPMEVKGFSSGVKVEIYLDDNLVQTVNVGSDGSFDAAGIELNLGTNNIFGKSIDEKNQASLPSKTVSVEYDNIKPNLDVSSPEDGKDIHSERKLNVSGKTDPDAYVFVNGSQAIVQSDGSFNQEISLSDGENNISIKSQDKAKNEMEIDRKINFTP